jgi:universal stress protein A
MMLSGNPIHRASRSLKAPRTETTMRLAKLLVPVDFSAESKNALRYAEAFARQFGASLTLLHVAEPIVYVADFGYGPVTRRCPNQRLLTRTKSRLNALAKKVGGSQLQPTSVVRTGIAESEIVDAARELETDLIVMGTHGNSGPGQAPMCSTAEKVLRHAPCPVFVVRKKEHEFV